MTAAQLTDLMKLTQEEKLDLIEALWESLSRSPNALPMPDWHRDVLDAREANEETDLGDTWDIVKARLEQQS